MTSTNDPDGSAERIAVIGMAGRLPGATDLTQFWRNELAMRDAVRPIPRERLIEAGRTEAELARPDFVAAEATFDGVAEFDAPFFQYSPAEAVLMDPQLRHLHEIAWHTLENAGFDGQDRGQRIGVFASTDASTWHLHNLAGAYRHLDTSELAKLLLVNGQDYPATTLAYRLGLTGPALNIHTACSGGLVAAATACDSLIAGNCDAALVVAASIKFPHGAGYFAPADSPLAKEGVCRPFDKAASGILAGDGVTGIMLKRLDDASRDGDRVIAVITGWAVNNDGRRKMGYVAPSTEGQREVLRDALAVAGIEPGEVDLIEAHGTGTRIGDPIEFSALDAVHGRAAADRRIGLTSLKGSVGHLGAAAGLAGLARAALAVRHGVMPATLNFRELNPQIDMEGSGLFVVTEPTPFPRHGHRPHRAGVSSFGIGGTNAHLIVEAPPPEPDLPEAAGLPEVVGLSADSRDALERSREALLDWLNSGEPLATETAFPSLPAIADASLLARPHLPFRLAASGHDLRSLSEALAARRIGKRHAAAPLEPRLCFVLPGTGAPLGSLAADLARRFPAFAEALEELDEALESDGRAPISAFLFDADSGPNPGKEARDPKTALIATFAFGLAHARLWRALGLKPALVIGHSLGEITAASVAGAIAPGEAVRLVAARADIIERHGAPGGLLAVAEAPARLEPRLAAYPDVAIAGENGAGRALVSGPTASIEALKADLAKADIATVLLPLGFAVHSPAMAATRAPVEALVKDRFVTPEIPLASTVTGRIETSLLADPGHWGGQMTGPIRFTEAVTAAAAAGCTVFLELGPRSMLEVGGRRTLLKQPNHAVWEVALKAGDEADGDAAALIARSRAALFEAGIATPSPHRARAARTALPGYPFARIRYWREDRELPGHVVRAEPTPAPAIPSVIDEADDPVLALLAEIWREELGHREISPTDSFLHLGGTSLSAIKVLGTIEQRLGVRPPILALIGSENLAAFADAVSDLLLAEAERTETVS